jgi:hypothetical protein
MKLTLTFVLALGVCGLWAAPARAYPQWQLSSGAVRCNQCHFAPAGGGLPNSYGRDFVGQDLSTFGGDGALLHGAVKLPSWLSLGGDFRGAFVAEGVQDPSGPTVAAFPMQADVEGRVSFLHDFSFYGVLGLRGEVRGDDDIVPADNYQPVSTSRLISREHWLMWQPESQGFYARAGRFFAPFGLRLAEHITYIRRDLGFDELQETYNLSGGYLSDLWEVHVTAFAPDFVRHIGSDESGVAAYYERRILNQTGVVAAQVRYASAPGITRTIAGGVGKYYLEPLKTLFLGEIDVVYLSLNDNLSGRGQVVGAAGFSVLPVKGALITVLGERNQEDVQVRDAARTAATLLLGWFPYAHVEIQLMGRAEFPDGLPATKTFFAQLHYFL